VRISTILLATLVAIALAVVGLLIIPSATAACLGSSCNTKVGAPYSNVGTVTLTVWLNFTDGTSQKLTSSGPVNLVGGSIFTGGKQLQAVTSKTTGSFNTTVSVSNVQVLVYENPAPGGAAAYIVNQNFNSLPAKVVVQSTSLAPNAQLLVYTVVKVSVNGRNYISGVPPVSILLFSTSTQTTATGNPASCPPSQGGVLMPYGSSFTDTTGHVWAVPGGNQGLAVWYSYFFVGPQSSTPPPMLAGWSGIYGTYNSQQGWIVSFYC
jgi:hypothetical protein